MLCKPVAELLSDEKWSFEIKFDGYRCVAVKLRREMSLLSRHKKVLNKRLPGVVDALASLNGDFVLDGELVALDSLGRPSFQVLQNNLSRSLPVYFYCFDLLHRDGKILLTLSIERRRELLHSMFAAPQDPLRLSPLLEAPSGQVLEAVRKLGLEGVVGKRIDSIYEPGERSGAWIKHRNEPRARVRHWRLHSRCAWVRCLARWRLRNQRAHLRREGERRFCAANSGRNLASSQKADSNALPIRKSTREKGLEMGRVADCRENEAMPLGHSEAGLPGRIPRMDGCRALEALHLPRHAR
jgi:bifunctional non-homologous end joining protein LigD